MSKDFDFGLLFIIIMIALSVDSCRQGRIEEKKKIDSIQKARDSIEIKIKELHEKIDTNFIDLPEPNSLWAN